MEKNGSRTRITKALFWPITDHELNPLPPRKTHFLVMMYNFLHFIQEFAPSDDELLAYRRGEEWNSEKAAEMAKQKELEKQLVGYDT